MSGPNREAFFPRHESLVGRRVTEVLKIFDYIQVVFDGQKSLNVYGSYNVSGRDSHDGKINKLLRSLIGRNVVRAVLLPSKLTLEFSEGLIFSVDGGKESEPYEFFSSAAAAIERNRA